MGEISVLEHYIASRLDCDIGRLIIRISISVLMLFHGIRKWNEGLGHINELLTAVHLPEFLAYGVYLGQLLVPALLIVGLYTRLASIYYVGTMIFAIFLAYRTELFVLEPKTGGLRIELPLLHLFAGAALVFLGAGKYSLDHRLKANTQTKE